MIRIVESSNRRLSEKWSNDSKANNILNKGLTNKDPGWKVLSDQILKSIRSERVRGKGIIKSIQMTLDDVDNFISKDVDRALGQLDQDEVDAYLEELYLSAPKLLGKELIPNLNKLISKGFITEGTANEIMKLLV